MKTIVGFKDIKIEASNGFLSFEQFNDATREEERIDIPIVFVDYLIGIIRQVVSDEKERQEKAES